MGLGNVEQLDCWTVQSVCSKADKGPEKIH